MTTNYGEKLWADLTMFRTYLTLSVGTYPPPTYCPHPTYLTQACLVPAAWILMRRQKADGEDVLAPICGYLYVAAGWTGTDLK